MGKNLYVAGCAIAAKPEQAQIGTTFSKPIAVFIQIGHGKNCFVFAVLM